MNDQTSASAPGQLKNKLDADLRGYLQTNADILTVVEKPVGIDDIGALSAQSEGPILFENIHEHPGFRLCDNLGLASPVNHHREHALPPSLVGGMVQTKPQHG